MTLTTSGVRQTRALGQRVGRAARPGLTVALVGSLGAGKTCLVKGMAEGLGVADADDLTSPTFLIIKEYPGPLWLYHVDAYRLGGADDLENIGFAELLRCGGVVCVEWADRVAEALPADCLRIDCEIVAARKRRFQFTATGPIARRVLSAVSECNPHDALLS